MPDEVVGFERQGVVLRQVDGTADDWTAEKLVNKFQQTLSTTGEQSSAMNGVTRPF
jgi:hypothetical protein